MIVDCHTHIWSDPNQLGEGASEYLARQSGADRISASAEDHQRAAECVDKTLVLGFRSVHLGADVPNDRVRSETRETWIDERTLEAHTALKTPAGPAVLG